MTQHSKSSLPNNINPEHLYIPQKIPHDPVGKLLGSGTKKLSQAVKTLKWYAPHILLLITALALLFFQMKPWEATTDNRSQADVSGEAQVIFEPATLTIEPGQSVPVTIQANAAQLQLTGLDLHAQVMGNEFLEITNVQLHDYLTTSLYQDLAAGQIRSTAVVTCDTTGCSLLTGTQPLATLTLKGIAEGSAQVLLTGTELSAVGSQQNVAVGLAPLAVTVAVVPEETVVPSTAPVPSPIPTPITSDTQAPVIEVVSPNANAVVDKNTEQQIVANVTDNGTIAEVQFFEDGKELCVVSSAPYVCNWTPRGKGNTKVVLKVRAYDVAGNQSIEQLTVVRSR